MKQRFYLAVLLQTVNGELCDEVIDSTEGLFPLSVIQLWSRAALRNRASDHRVWVVEYECDSNGEWVETGKIGQQNTDQKVIHFFGSR